MSEQALHTRFWLRESETTARVFARIPDRSEYRPDPRSRTAQEIAWQMICEERFILDALETGTAEWVRTAMPDSMRAIEATWERERAQMAERWKALPAARWEGTVQLFGRARPAAPLAWSFLFDIVHHRGQITTYLRPMGSTVPQVYGPTADEP